MVIREFDKRKMIRTLEGSMQTYGNHIFAGKLYLKKNAPLFHLAPTTEIEYPWRVCKNSLVIKYFPKRGIVLGMWQKNNREWHETVLDILEGRYVDIKEAAKAGTDQSEISGDLEYA